MRIAGIWTTLIVGGILLTGVALAQSPDDEEQGSREQLTPSTSGEAALAQSADDEGQGLGYQAPSVQVWMGRFPSKAELQAALTQARAQGKRLAPSASDTPDFQNGRVKIYRGRLPTPESLRNMLGSGGGGR